MTSAFEMLGFVSLDDIRNTIAMEREKIKEDINRNRIPADHKTYSLLMDEYVDAIEMKLMQRAQDNLKNYLTQNPHVRKEMREVRDARDQTEQKKSWKERVEKSRQKAIAYNNQT